jgi:hypothetical protein
MKSEGYNISPIKREIEGKASEGGWVERKTYAKNGEGWEKDLERSKT